MPMPDRTIEDRLGEALRLHQGGIEAQLWEDLPEKSREMHRAAGRDFRLLTLPAVGLAVIEEDDRR
jgi:hypothetical protein